MCTKLHSAKHLIGFGMATFFRCKITIDHEILFAGQRSLLILSQLVIGMQEPPSGTGILGQFSSMDLHLLAIWAVRAVEGNFINVEIFPHQVFKPSGSPIVSKCSEQNPKQICAAK